MTPTQQQPTLEPTTATASNGETVPDPDDDRVIDDARSLAEQLEMSPNDSPATDDGGDL